MDIASPLSAAVLQKRLAQQDRNPGSLVIVPGYRWRDFLADVEPSDVAMPLRDDLTIGAPIGCRRKRDDHD